MNLHAPLAAWIILGVPPSVAFLRRGRWDLAVAVLPFAGGLAITCPWILSAATGRAVFWWFVESFFASLALWAFIEIMLGRKDRSRIAPAPPGPKQNLYLTLAALVVVLVAAGFSVYWGLVLADGFPDYAWDGYMIWLLRAKVLADIDAFPKALAAEPMLSASHWEYPLLFPAVLGWFRRFGGLDVRQLAAPIGLIGAIIPVAGWIGLRRSIGAGFAAAVVLAPLVIHGTLRFHFGAYADLSVAMATTIAFALAAAGVTRSDRTMLVAGSIALAAAVATKNEGTLWLLAGGAGVGLLALDTGLGIKKSVSTTLRWVVPAIVFFAVWQFACRQTGATYSLISNLHFANLHDRLWVIVKDMATRSLQHPKALIMLGASLLGMILLARGAWYMRLRRMAVLLGGPVLYCTGIVVIYLGTPHRLKWHLATSVERVLYGVAPVILVAAIFAGAKRKTKSKPAGKSKPLQPAER